MIQWQRISSFRNELSRYESLDGRFTIKHIRSSGNWRLIDNYRSMGGFTKLHHAKARAEMLKSA